MAGRSFVPGSGCLETQLAFVGQGPGEVEAYQGKPFVGTSGDLLVDWLHRAGLQRREVWITNIVQCWLPKNRAPTPKERARCWETHVKRELEALPNLKVILPVGVPAMDSLLGRKCSEREAGNIITYEDREEYLEGVDPLAAGRRAKGTQEDSYPTGRGVLIIQGQHSLDRIKAARAASQLDLPLGELPRPTN